LKKDASSFSFLHRSGFAQASCHFAVLMYRLYALRVKMAVALLDEPFEKTQGMLF